MRGLIRLLTADRNSARIVPLTLPVKRVRIQSNCLIAGGLQWPKLLVPTSLKLRSVQNGEVLETGTYIYALEIFKLIRI